MLNQNKKYNNCDSVQASKEKSLLISKDLVKDVKELFSPYLSSCELYEPNENLRIKNAPAVRVNERLVIAPDIKCITNSGKVFWIEVKDKAQRFYYSDTGADLHQVLGQYDINKYLNEPVLVVFKDPDLNSCIPKKASKPSIDKFRKRWELFGGNLYGGWLCDLLFCNNKLKYPCVFEEKSRELKMNILYFDINKMSKIDEPHKFIKNINNNIIQELEVFQMEYCNGKKNKKRLKESELRGLSYGGL